MVKTPPHPIYTSMRRSLNPLDNLCSFGVKLRSVPIVRFLLAVFQAIALVVLQQAVLATVVPVAESTVADDSLGSLFAVLVGAADLLGGHAASKGHGQVQGGLPVDIVVCERT